MKKIKYLVLGAGVSGLAFSSRIASDDYLIIEKESRPGGYCRTTRNNGFIWDYAGHFFHFSNSDLKKDFESITSSDETVTKEKNTKIYYNGQYIDYPFQKNIHQLPKEEMIDCLYDLFEKKEKDVYDSFLDMLYGKFGIGITEKFLRPYNEKLYACNLDSLDVDAMGRFFPYAEIKEIIRNMKSANNASYNQTFMYPKRGAEVFVEKLLEKIPSDRIHLNEEVITINTTTKHVVTNKDEYIYEYLISSIPLNHFIKYSDLSADIDDSIISYNQVLVFNLGFDKPSIDKKIHWIYIPSKKINFYRAGFYNNIIGSDNLSLYIEIGYPKEKKITHEEIKNQLNLTIEGLKELGIIDNHNLIAYEAKVMDPAYVHVTKNSIMAVDSLKNKLKGRGVFLIGRYGSWKYCSIEDCMIDALNIVKLIEN